MIQLLIYIGVAAIILVAVWAILQRVPLDPALRNIIVIAAIVIVAILAVALLLRLPGVAL